MLTCVCVCVVQVKVMLRVCPVDAGRSSFLSCNEQLRHVTLLDQSVCGAGATSPATPRRRPTAPKTFAFDAVFTQDTSLVSSTVYYITISLVARSTQQRAHVCSADVYYLLFHHYKPNLRDAPTVIHEIVTAICRMSASL